MRSNCAYPCRLRQRFLTEPFGPRGEQSTRGNVRGLICAQEGIDVSAAALNAVKGEWETSPMVPTRRVLNALLHRLGQPMAIDLFSFTQKDLRVFSFMSQCVGLMAELDLWTEHLRFLGNGYVCVPPFDL